MKTYPTFLFLVSTLMFCPMALAEPLVLITPAEASASAAAGGMLVPRSLAKPNAPRIEVLSPDLSKPVVMPARIEIRFVTEKPAEAAPESFRAQYGAFRIDITKRLLGFTKVTKDGILVSEAVLPSGSHQIALSVADSMEREGQRVISFTVP